MVLRHLRWLILNLPDTGRCLAWPVVAASGESALLPLPNVVWASYCTVHSILIQHVLLWEAPLRLRMRLVSAVAVLEVGCAAWTNLRLLILLSSGYRPVHCLAGGRCSRGFSPVTCAETLCELYAGPVAAICFITFCFALSPLLLRMRLASAMARLAVCSLMDSSVCP